MNRWLIVFFGILSSLGFAKEPVILEMRLNPNIFDMEQPKVDCKIPFGPDSPEYDKLVELVTKVQQNPQLNTGFPVEGPDLFYQVQLNGVPTLLYLNNVYFEMKNQSDEAKELIDFIRPLCLFASVVKLFEEGQNDMSNSLKQIRPLGTGY